MEQKEKKGYIRKASYILVAVNLALFLVKWIPSTFYFSVSLKADAFNSLGDLGYSLLFALGLKFAFKPKDGSHPHGHERIEPFVSLVVSSMIIFTGVWVVVHAIQSLINPRYSFSFILVISLAFSAMIKYWLSDFLAEKAEETASTALSSSSKDAKVDVLASLAALVGVIGARVGVLFLDAVLGILVSFWIFKTGIEIAKKNFGYLIGVSAPDEVTEEVKRIMNENEEVISFYDLEAHYVGPEIHISLSAELSADTDFEEVHRVEESLRKKIMVLKDVDSVYIHLEPKDSDFSSQKD